MFGQFFARLGLRGGQFGDCAFYEKHCFLFLCHIFFRFDCHGFHKVTSHLLPFSKRWLFASVTNWRRSISMAPAATASARFDLQMS